MINGTSVGGEDASFAAADTATATVAEEVVSACCLDPYDYPYGNVKVESLPRGVNPDMRTFHANYCRSKEVRIEKLRKVRADGLGWNEDRIDYSYLNESTA